MAATMRVTGAWVQLLSDWLDRENLPAPELRTVLDSRGAADIVPLSLWQELLAKAVRLRPNQLAPGLEIGAGVQPRHVGVLGYLILTCQTLGDAMAAYQRYEELFYGRNLVDVEVQGSDITVCWPATDSLGKLADSAGLAALVRFLHRLVEEPPSPSLVSFVFAAPGRAEQQAYEAFFGCPVGFSAEQSCVQFPLALLATPLPHSDTSMRAMLDRQAQAMLLALPDAQGFDRALQQAMVRLMPEGRISLPNLAGALHVSVRTLQRRLADRSLTWQALLDRTRAQLARHYLADPTLTLSDIALLLGFSEHSAFSRAHRRWTGRTPAQARGAVKEVTRWR